MHALDLISVLLLLVGVFGWVNLRFLHLPIPVGLLAIGLAASLIITAVDAYLPSWPLGEMLQHLMKQVNFSRAVLDFLLCFLMFSAGMSVNVKALRGMAWTAGVLATFGIVLPTVLVGFGFYGIGHLFGSHFSLAWSLVFGALISPTDPAALLAAIKRAPLPKDVMALLQGESVFNDGVAIVLFGALLAAAINGEHLDLETIASNVVVEGGGAVVLGVVGAWIAVRAMHEIDDYSVETAITIALASGIYALTEHLGWSGPIATATAGLLVGTERASKAMSDLTQRYVRGFWNLSEEILNAVLFLLIGLEVIAVEFQPRLVWPAICAVFVVLLGRVVSVTPPAFFLARSRETIGFWIIPVLTWSGARGGVSIALALTLPDNRPRAVILAATYAVVLFSIFVQSMSIGAMIRRLGLEQEKRVASHAEAD